MWRVWCWIQGPRIASVAMGFCTIRSLATACRRRVAPLMLQIPPFAGSEIAVRGGEDAVRGGEDAVRGGEVTVRGGVAPT